MRTTQDWVSKRTCSRLVGEKCSGVRVDNRPVRVKKLVRRTYEGAVENKEATSWSGKIFRKKWREKHQRRERQCRDVIIWIPNYDVIVARRRTNVRRRWLVNGDVIVENSTLIGWSAKWEGIKSIFRIKGSVMIWTFSEVDALRELWSQVSRDIWERGWIFEPVSERILKISSKKRFSGQPYDLETETVKKYERIMRWETKWETWNWLTAIVIICVIISYHLCFYHLLFVLFVTGNFLGHLAYPALRTVGDC